MALCLAIPLAGQITDGTVNSFQKISATAGDGQIDLHWNPNAEADFLKYYIYGGTATAPTALVDSTAGGNLNDTTATLAGLSNGSTYHYRITAVDGSGNESAYQWGWPAPGPPRPPCPRPGVGRLASEWLTGFFMPWEVATAPLSSMRLRPTTH